MIHDFGVGDETVYHGVGDGRRSRRNGHFVDVLDFESTAGFAADVFNLDGSGVTTATGTGATAATATGVTAATGTGVTAATGADATGAVVASAVGANFIPQCIFVTF